MNTNTPTRTRTLPRLAAIGVAALAAVGLSLSAAAPALAHDELVGVSSVGTPSSGEAPGIQLDFNNEVMEMGSEMIATDADGNSLLDGMPVPDGRSVKQLLFEGIADGEYTVAWRVVSSDGHPIQGQLAIIMSDGFVSEVTPVAAPEANNGTPQPEASDEAEAPIEPEVTTQAQESDSGFPVAGWVAIAVVLVAVAGFGVFAAKKRKRSGSEGVN